MWADKYMAIPYKDGGRDWSGVDCFGAYALVLADQGVMTLPAYKGISYGTNLREAIRMIERALITGEFIKVAEGDGRAMAPIARRFDAVLMSCYHVDDMRRASRVDCHIGCALGDGFVLHTESPFGPRTLKLDDIEIRSRVRGICRPRLLA